ncbi:hypothetical protein ACFL3P_01475 [Pseudomonadota bacterium]
MKFKFTALLVLSLALTGCLSATKMYDGNELSDSKIAIIKGMNPSDPTIPKGWSAFVDSVDGIETPDNGAHIAILPGEHTLKVTCSAAGSPPKSHTLTEKFPAGSKYVIATSAETDKCHLVRSK